jgi:tetratricopeptide (TPR) repeat protein
MIHLSRFLILLSGTAIASALMLSCSTEPSLNSASQDPILKDQGVSDTSHSSVPALRVGKALPDLSPAAVSSPAPQISHSDLSTLESPTPDASLAVSLAPFKKAFEVPFKIWDTGNPSMQFLVLFESSTQATERLSLPPKQLVQHYQDRLAEESATPELLFNLATAYLWNNDYLKAQTLALTILKEAPESPPALYLLALSQLKLGHEGNLHNTAETFQRAVQSETPAAHSLIFGFLLGQVVEPYHLGMMGEDMRFYTAYRDTFREKIDFLDDTLDADFRSLALNLIQLRRGALLTDKQRSLYEAEGLEMQRNEDIFKVWQTQILFLDNPQQAEQQAAALLEQNPRSAQLYVLKASMKEKLQRPFPEISDALQKAIALAPGWAEPVSFLSDLWYKEGKYQESLALIDSALQREAPFSASLVLTRARAYRALGNYAEALKDYQYYLDLFPEDYKVRLFKATTLVFMRDEASLTLAIKEFGHVIDTLAPKLTQRPYTSDDYYAALDARGKAYFEIQDYERSYADLLAYYQAHLSSNDAKYNLSGVLGMLGRYDEAIGMALRVTPDYKYINLVYNNLYHAYSGSGKCDLATEYAQKANIMHTAACIQA